MYGIKYKSKKKQCWSHHQSAAYHTDRLETMVIGHNNNQSIILFTLSPDKILHSISLNISGKPAQVPQGLFHYLALALGFLVESENLKIRNGLT